MSLAGKRVLVVDDDPRNRLLLRDLLAGEGCLVDEAENGEDCVAKVLARSPDLILLDVMMPVMDGIECCRRIRQRRELLDIPIVFVTALGDRDSRIHGKAAGGDDFLTKPIDETELWVRVDNLLKVKEYHDLQASYRDHLESEVRQRTGELRQALSNLEASNRLSQVFQREAIHRLTRAAEFRDDETAMHIERMSHYCEFIGRRMALSAEACEQLLIARPMHDVGKIATPDRILLKPGKLTPEEFEIMKRHAAAGHAILEGSESPLLELAATIAWTHHEKWDGSGYPRGLARLDIPECGRIAAVADVFDALTSKRVYKPAFSTAQAVGILREERGRHFDPQILDAFLESLDEVLAIRARYGDTSDRTLAGDLPT